MTCDHSPIDQYSTPDPFGFGTDYSFATSIGVSTIANLGCSSLGDSNSQLRRAGTWHYVDNLSWVHGQHNIKVGGEFRYVFENGYDAFGSRPVRRLHAVSGTLAYRSLPVQTGVTNDESFRRWGQACSALSVFNRRASFSIRKHNARQQTISRYVQHEYGAFFQDQWKLRPNLTLQLGLRYQFDGVPFERDGQLSNLFANPAGPAPLTFSAVGPGTGQELYYNDPFNFEPRFGLAWDPFSSGKTSVRVGYGIFHDRIFGNLFTNLKSNPPFVGNFQNYVAEWTNCL